MNKLFKNGVVLTGLTLALPLLGACQSAEIENYQDEIAALREERTGLKKENRNLRLQLDNYEVQLAEANLQLSNIPDNAYPDLDALGIGVGQRGGNLVLSVPAEITFGSGKADLSKKGQNALAAVASTLIRDYPDGKYWIEGHTDTDPISKSNFDSNRHLSVMRAMAVLHYLVETAGLADDQCVVVGHGEYLPVAENDTKTNKALNRRVEIVVHARAQ